MENKILIEEINRINELTGSKAIFTESKPFILTENLKTTIKVVDDLFKVGKTAGRATITLKAAKNIKLPKAWSVFKDLGKLNVGAGKAGSTIKSYMKHGIKTGKNMDPALRKIIGQTDDVGGAIASKLHTAEMKQFLASGSQTATQIRKNIGYSLQNAPKLQTTLNSTIKFKTNVVKTKPVKTTTGGGRNVNKLTTKEIGRQSGVVVKKITDGIKTVWSASKRAVKWAFGLKFTGKLLLVFGLWLGYNYVRSLFENGDDEMSILDKMKAAFTGGLATAAQGSDIVVTEAQAEIYATEVTGDHSLLLEYVPLCVTLQDISMISKHYAAKNNDTELFDVLSAYKDTDPEKAPGLGGLYGELETEIADYPILSIAGVLCYTPNQVKAAYDKAGLDMDKAPGPVKIEGLEQDWSAYPCVLAMFEEYDGTVGHSGDLEYIMIQIDDREAYFLPDGTCQLEDMSNPKVNLKGSYACAGEEVEVTEFNESRKLSDILKENNIITEEDEIVYFGDATITIGGLPSTDDDPSNTEYNADGSVKSRTTTTTTPGIKYVMTTVTLADVVAGKGVLKKGDMGDSVRAIQTAVNTKVDSKFGPNTEEAVRVYQKRNGLTVTGTITQETAKRIAGTVDVDQGKVNANVVTKPKEEVIVVTKTDANEMDKVVTALDNTEDVYIKDQIADLETQVSRAPTKEACKTLIASARAGMKKGVFLKDLSSLKQCYNSYNFNAWGDGSRKVRKHYGLKGKGNI